MPTQLVEFLLTLSKKDAQNMFDWFCDNSNALNEVLDTLDESRLGDEEPVYHASQKLGIGGCKCGTTGCATLGENTETEFGLLTKLQNLRTTAEHDEPVYSHTIQKYVDASEPIYSRCNERVR